MLGFALLMSGCVTNKKMLLLQKDDVNKKNLPTDSVMRGYETVFFDYRIQENDLVSVRFEGVTPKEFDFLSQQQGNVNNIQNLGMGAALFIGDLVDKQGYIPFPFMGKIKVGGLTVYQIQDMIQSFIRDYLETATVKVRLLNYRITLLGELNKEGTILLNNNRVSMLEAIGLAGGMTDLADRANVKLVRQKGDSVQVSYINLLKEDFINSPYYYVYQNDILVVPPLRQRPYRKYFGQNLALLISTLTLLILVANLNK